MNQARWLWAGSAVIGAGLAGLLLAFDALTGAALADEQEQQQATRTVCAAPAQGRQQTASWEPAQRHNAAVIVAVAQQRGLPPRAAQIAVATAMQESSLRNRDFGDRDSLGPFQQRPSQGWGTAAQVRDPRHAAGQFYDRLEKIDGWQHKPLTKVAQAVQRSAHPRAYAKWEQAAGKMVRSLWDGARLPELPADGGRSLCGAGSREANAPASTRARAVIAAAREQIGKPYVWGGGNHNGPTHGGFDCSGLMLYVFYQGTGGAVTLPRTSQQQRSVGRHVSVSAMRPGNLIVINNDGGWGHVGLYVGNGRMINAPRTGKDVAEVDLGYWRQFPVGRAPGVATRPSRTTRMTPRSRSNRPSSADLCLQL